MSIKGIHHAALAVHEIDAVAEQLEVAGAAVRRPDRRPNAGRQLGNALAFNQPDVPGAATPS